jgi:NADPH2:quinone reductase
MKAAVYYETGGPEVFRYEELPDPVCHPRGLVIDVEAISIEGGDVLHRAGGKMPSRPHIVGYQCAGTVREAGAEVVGVAVIADRATGAAEKVEAEGLEYRFAFGLEDLGLAGSPCRPWPRTS